MDNRIKVVTRLPMSEVWRDDGLVISARGRSLTAEDIKALLRIEPVQFVVADLGLPPRWIQLKDCYTFWKEEAKSHLATGDRIILDEYPNSYCYFASEWSTAEASTSIVLLEKHH